MTTPSMNLRLLSKGRFTALLSLSSLSPLVALGCTQTIPIQPAEFTNTGTTPGNTSTTATTSNPLAEVEPGEWLPGGATTNVLLLGSNAFIRPAENILVEHEPSFYSGNSFFNQAWVEAPASTTARDGLGPLFNARSCAACHFRDGRGQPPADREEAFLSMLLRLSIPGTAENGGTVPDPNYGGQLQPFALPDTPAEGHPFIEYEELEGQFPDGTEYSLMSPTYKIDDLAYGPLSDDIMISPRVAPQVIGLGLLEAITPERLNELADPDDNDGDGISGRINRVWDASAQSHRIGRFGWKAEQPSVKQQSAGALLGDMGITSPVFGVQNCSENQVECLGTPGGGETDAHSEIQPEHFDKLVMYTQLLAVPARRNWEDDTVLRGKKLFGDLGCAQCHVPNHQTGNHELVEVTDQSIWPYTDMLLHDMGDELSDNRPSFEAQGNEWRTPPLWGIGLFEDVNKHTRLLHDGRARNMEEAILWHGGEGQSSRDAFMELATDDREAVITFVNSL